jgi:hypothetical protein
LKPWQLEAHSHNRPTDSATNFAKTASCQTTIIDELRPKADGTDRTSGQSFAGIRQICLKSGTKVALPALHLGIRARMDKSLAPPRRAEYVTRTPENE